MSAPDARHGFALSPSRLLGWLLAASGPKVVTATLSPGASPVASPGASEVARLTLLNDEYLHARYNFSLIKPTSRHGQGELWLTFAGGAPRLRMHGAAELPSLGLAEITLVADAGAGTVYTLVRLPELKEVQCLRHSFPNLESFGGLGNGDWLGDIASADRQRLRTLRWRRDQVVAWEEAPRSADPDFVLPINWTQSSELDVVLGDNGRELRRLDLRRNHEVVKTVELVGISERSSNVPVERLKDIFGPPDMSDRSLRCISASQVTTPMAHILLQPPHSRSTALRDLLLILGDMAQGYRKGETVSRWPRSFIVISAVAVPGDVMVLFEEPKPPSFKSLKSVSFDYSSEAGLGTPHSHTSSGRMWLRAPDKAFHIRGNSFQTEVGAIEVDLIARAGAVDRGVFVKVNLTLQSECQCVTYSYPTNASQAAGQEEELHQAASKGFEFLHVAELRGEDCIVFAASIGRGRKVLLWMGVDAGTHSSAVSESSVLRVEIVAFGASGRRVLRRTEVLRWSEEDDFGYLSPPVTWNCGMEEGREEQIAFVGLRGAERWSAELREVLVALRDLPADFVLTEVLALAGDLSLSVRLPEAPDLWNLPAASFDFTLSMYAPNGAGGLGFQQETVTGNLASNLANKGGLRATCSVAGTQVLLALEPTSLSVRLQEEGQAVPVCLTLPLPSVDQAQVNASDTGLGDALPLWTAVMPGVFEGVDMVGDRECDRFRYAAAGPKSETVVLWYSQAEMAVCRLQVQEPPREGSQTGVVADFTVTGWEEIYSPGGGKDDPVSGSLAAGSDAAWRCGDASQDAQSWLRLAPRESVDLALPDSLPAATSLSTLAVAASAVGILPSRAADVLSRLVVMSRLHPAPAAAAKVDLGRLGILSPELKGFSFSFTSHRLDESASQSGHGEIYVDLVRMRLLLRSALSNYSSGIPEAESQIVFRGDKGNELIARTELRQGPGDPITRQRCWKQKADPQRLDDQLPPMNPFTRATPKEQETLAVARGHKAYALPQGGSAERRVEILVDGKTGALAELWILKPEAELRSAQNWGTTVGRDSTDVLAVVKVASWSSQLPDAAWFDAYASDGETQQTCKEISYRRYPKAGQHFAGWDLLRVLFPAK